MLIAVTFNSYETTKKKVIFKIANFKKRETIIKQDSNEKILRVFKYL